MNSHHPTYSPRTIALTAAAIAAPWALNSCRPDAEKPEDPIIEVTHVAKLHENALTKDISNLVSSQVSSPIHWQTWDKSLFDHAASERKTIFALIGSGTDANTLEILDRLNKSPSSCNLLNEHHVNVLIDSNIHPDIEFFTSLLCMKSRTPVATPLLVWFSYEGNPISWSPVGPRSSRDIDELISRMSNTVYQVWRDDPEYVLKNSRDDFKRRIDMSVPEAPEGDSSDLALRSIRQAASLFDPTSGAIDGIGNLSPSRYVELLVQASHHADSSDIQKKRYNKIATLAADHILLRGLIDPLDGGVYSGMQKTTSALPRFTKTLRGQAFAMNALYSLYQTTKNDDYLQAADSIAAFTEKHLTLPDGGYLSGVIYATNQVQDNPCIWTLEEIEAALTDKEVRICTIAFGLKGLGNIPLIDDPDRAYFRQNTFTWKVTHAELARQTSLDPADLKQRLESITKKLAKLRTEKPHKPFVENLSTAGSSALYVSACVTGYRATGNPSHLEKAQKSLNYIKDNFLDDNGALHRARFSGKLNSNLATGSDFALVCRAALDLHEVTLDPAWLEFSYDLHQRMNKLLADPDHQYIQEYDGGQYPKTYQTRIYYTIPSLNNDNTWGLVYANAKRLGLRFADDTISLQTNNLQGSLLRSSSTAPIASIDFLTEDTKLNQKNVYIKAPVTPELLLTACKHICQIVLVTDKGNYPELGNQAASLTAGTATVVALGKVIGTTSDTEALNELLK